MTIKELCSKIAKQEGKKHQASIGDVREIVGLICDEILCSSDNDLAGTLYAMIKNARRRLERRKKK